MLGFAMHHSLISTRRRTDYLGQVIPSRLFRYSKGEKLFAADRSQLREFNPTGQLYDDAIDQGFLMESTSGDTVPFVLIETDRDGGGEGEVGGWRFKPDSYALRRRPDLSGVRVLIINT